MLQSWERNFDALQEVVEFCVSRGILAEGSALEPRKLDVLPPILRPSKMLYAAANYVAHVRDLRASGFAAKDADLAKDTFAEKETLRPYAWLKAPSTLTGAYDDIVLPSEGWNIDWEVELAFAIGPTGKRISENTAMGHVAGLMTTNDISCRDLTFRSDRPALRSDWLGGKNLDTFAPMGPVLVPRVFVPNSSDLRLTLRLNGEMMQDGNTRDMIFSPEEQIAYVSRLMTLEPGDVFATGSPEGNGQSRGFFLKPGDILESDVAGVGKMVNRVVSEGESP